MYEIVHGFIIGIDHRVDMHLELSGLLQAVDELNGADVQARIGDAGQADTHAGFLRFE